MKIKPIKDNLKRYIKEHQIQKKFDKAKTLFEQDINHPSLNIEILEPKNLKVYSFRVNKKYRAIFIVTDGEAEILTITNHYK